MPKIIQTTVYTIDELSENSKKVARQWYLDGADIVDDSFCDMVEDAKQIGLQIDSLRSHYSLSGSFIDSAATVAEAIKANHGEDCTTYKIAEKFLQQYEKTSELNFDKDAIENEFLTALLKDYFESLNDTVSHLKTDSVVDESIRDNDYTFTDSGKRFG